MPENSQNMKKKRKNSVFLTFWGTPGGSAETPEIKKNIFEGSIRCLLSEQFIKCQVSTNLAFPVYDLGQNHEKWLPVLYGGQRRTEADI